MTKIEIECHTNSDKKEYGFAEVRQYSPQETMMKMLKALGMFWGLAVVSVFLPVVHFVLVPLFLVIGILAALRARKYHEEILLGKIKCPQCGTCAKIGKMSVIWPLSEICQGCASVMRISPRT